MLILGLNAYHGDSAAALIRDGKIIAAIEEERINRIKHWAGFPVESVKFVLNYAGVSIKDIDYLTIGRDPKAKIIQKGLRSLRKLFSSKFLKDRVSNIKRVINVKDDLSHALNITDFTKLPEISHIEHHRSHLASAFYPSPFEKSAILSIDGFGDFSSTMLAYGEENRIKVIDSVSYPHSLGIFYTAFTQYLGFPWYGDEYKVMGLAPYGEPKYSERLKKIIYVTPDGLFKLNDNYFTHSKKGVSMTWDNGAPFIDSIYSVLLVKEFGKPREKDELLIQFHKDLAASVQKVCEEIIFGLLNHLYHITGSENICLAGGVAQNSVTNGKILEKTRFKNVYIPSAGYDAGTAVGSTLYLYHNILGNKKREFINSAYWGREFSEKEILDAVNGELGIVNREKGVVNSEWRIVNGQKFKIEIMDNDEETVLRTAELLAGGAVAGWFQGRTEFGPRALGNRSVLVHPGRSDAKELINSKIKRRESFRPFAPSILREFVHEYFETDDNAYFMEKVFRIKKDKRTLIPAVTHVDGTGRLQTVHKEISPKYYMLIDEFRKITGLPLLLNTSFNENEPIVNTPKEAIDCFLRTEMDLLVMENIIISRIRL